MSCPICYESYDDYIEERRCYNICQNSGHTVCERCMLTYTRRVCPVCNGPRPVDAVLTRINNAPMELEAPPSGRPVVLLIDTSGSMHQSSGRQSGAPPRVELAVHMAKTLLAFCRKLKIPCVLYTFSEGIRRVPVDEKTSPAEAHRELDRIRPNGQTNLGLALETILHNHGETGKYFVFTDGEPTDSYLPSISKFVDTQLHLFAFGKDVNTDLLYAVGGGPLHTISYIQDVASISGYMVPVFIWATTNMKRVVLNEVDEECRQQFVRILAPQIKGDMSTYKMADLVAGLQRIHPRATTTYSHDLETDTTGTPAHGRISYSFQRDNWRNFGKFYLPCILHCHKYLIPGNAFDPSLKHYRTSEYQEIFSQIADVPMSVDFVSFMRQGSQQAAAAVVQKTFQYMDTYSYSSSSLDDGCIGPEALIRVIRDQQVVTLPMREVVPGDLLERGRIKWILRISNLNHGQPIPLYHGLTNSHPIQAPSGKWIPARDYPGATVTSTPGVVYDVILDDPTVDSMSVNGIRVAVVGYPVPGMLHPYWGTQKVVDDVRARCPEGGFVDVDAEQFQHQDGLVSSLF